MDLLRGTFVMFSLCRVGGLGGHNLSENDSLEKSFTPLLFESSSQIIGVKLGDTVRLPCQVQTTEKVRTLWKMFHFNLNKEAKEVSGSSGINVKKLKNGSMLTIERFQGDHSGVYVCEATVGSARPIILSHKVKLNEPPRVSILGVSNGSVYQVLEGEELALICYGDSGDRDSLPALYWTKLGGLMPDGKREIAGEQVIIQRINRKHAGLYQCRGERDNNSQSSLLRVEVVYGPDVRMFKNYIHNRGRVMLEIVCEVDSNPPSIITFFKDGVAIPNTTSSVTTNSPKRVTTTTKSVLTHNTVLHVRDDLHIVSISSPSLANLGIYSCQAANAHGSSKKEITLRGLAEFIRSASVMSEGAVNIEQYYPKLFAVVALICTFIIK